MTYRPAESMFGPPFTARIPSVLYAILALVAVLIVASAEMGQSALLKAYLIDRPHPIEARTFAALLVVGAVSSLVRSGMRGVRIRGDAVEYRDVAALGWPKVRRYKWAQIDRIVFEEESIALDLWDGTRAFLPVVSDARGLSSVLETIAAARAIPVSGGAGLDEIPESEEFDTDPP